MRTTRKPTSPQPVRPTPVPPADLVACADELRALVGELCELTGCGAAWGMRVVRRNIELALLSPRTLDTADNQLDFIEELAEALWDGADAGFRHAVTPAGTSAETDRREERRRAIVDRLDELVHDLCAAAEAWRDLVVAAAEAARAGCSNPQEGHSS